MSAFSVTQYASDGEILASGDLVATQLSSRWLEICRDILDVNGPVFSRSMGSTLERFVIECAGPMCHFKVGSSVLYTSALLVNAAKANHEEVVAWFAAQLDSGAPFAAPSSFPAFLVLNTLAPGIEDADRKALFQLACHFASAYFAHFDA